MQVFWKQKLVFLSVPKTGTTAYEEALADAADITIGNPPGVKHMPLRRFDRALRPALEKLGLESFDTLAVIREPVDWLGSWYRYRSRPFLEGKANSTKDIDFDAFASAYMQDDQPSFARVGSQARFVAPQDGAAPITHLFRYEDQTALQAFLEARFERAITPARRNVSPARDTKLSPAVEAKLRHDCAEEFALWDRIGR